MRPRKHNTFFSLYDERPPNTGTHWLTERAGIFGVARWKMLLIVVAPLVVGYLGVLFWVLKES